MDDKNHDTPRGDDYLWDRSGPPDPDVARLEQQLGGFRNKPGALDPDVLDVEPATDAAASPHPAGDAPTRSDPAAASARDATSPKRPAPLGPIRWHRWLGRTMAAAAALFAAVSLWHWYAESHDPVARPGGYRFEPLAGVAVLERLDPGGAVPIGKLATGTLIDDTRDIEPGHRVVTDPDARGRLVVGDIGSVTLEGNSRLRVEEADALPGDDAQYALYLERGTLEASIFAAPRLFQVGTPSGIAVDMGCVYRTTVDDQGRVWLSVTLGLVSFEFNSLFARDREVLVPEGATCRAWPGRGPGTPVWDDAPDRYKRAVEALDAFVPMFKVIFRDSAKLKYVLEHSRNKDSLTLWHLIDHEEPTIAEAAYERLAELVPPPPFVTYSGLRGGDETMCEAWKDAFEWSW